MANPPEWLPPDLESLSQFADLGDEEDEYYLPDISQARFSRRDALAAAQGASSVQEAVSILVSQGYSVREAGKIAAQAFGASRAAQGGVSPVMGGAYTDFLAAATTWGRTTSELSQIVPESEFKNVSQAMGLVQERLGPGLYDFLAAEKRRLGNVTQEVFSAAQWAALPEHQRERFRSSKALPEADVFGNIAPEPGYWMKKEQARQINLRKSLSASWIGQPEEGQYAMSSDPSKIYKRLQQAGSHPVMELTNRPTVRGGMRAGPGARIADQYTALNMGFIIGGEFGGGIGQGYIDPDVGSMTQRTVKRLAKQDMPHGVTEADLAGVGTTFERGEDIKFFKGHTGWESPWFESEVLERVETPVPKWNAETRQQEMVPGYQYVMEQRRPVTAGGAAIKAFNAKAQLEAAPWIREWRGADPNFQLDVLMPLKVPEGAPFSQFMWEWTQGGGGDPKGTKKARQRIAKELGMSLKKMQGMSYAELEEPIRKRFASQLQSYVQTWRGPVRFHREQEQWFSPILTGKPKPWQGPHGEHPYIMEAEAEMQVMAFPGLSQIEMEYGMREPFYNPEEMARMRQLNPTMAGEIEQYGGPLRQAYRGMVGAAVASTGYRGYGQGQWISADNPQVQAALTRAEEAARAYGLARNELGEYPDRAQQAAKFMEYMASEEAGLPDLPVKWEKGGRTLYTPGFQHLTRFGAKGVLEDEEVSGYLTSVYEMASGWNTPHVAEQEELEGGELTTPRMEWVYQNQARLAASEKGTLRTQGLMGPPGMTGGGIATYSPLLAANEVMLAGVPEEYAATISRFPTFFGTWDPRLAGRQASFSAEEEAALGINPERDYVSPQIMQALSGDVDADLIQKLLLGPVEMGDEGIPQLKLGDQTIPLSKSGILARAEIAKQRGALDLMTETLGYVEGAPWGKGAPSLEEAQAYLEDALTNKVQPRGEQELETELAKTLRLYQNIGPQYGTFARRMMAGAEEPLQQEATATLHELSHGRAQRPERLQPLLENLQELGTYTTRGGVYKRFEQKPGRPGAGSGLGALRRYVGENIAGLVAQDKSQGSLTAPQAASLLAGPGQKRRPLQQAMMALRRAKTEQQREAAYKQFFGELGKGGKQGVEDWATGSVTGRMYAGQWATRVAREALGQDVGYDPLMDLDRLSSQQRSKIEGRFRQYEVRPEAGWQMLENAQFMSAYQTVVSKRHGSEGQRIDDLLKFTKGAEVLGMAGELGLPGEVPDEAIIPAIWDKLKATSEEEKQQVSDYLRDPGVESSRRRDIKGILGKRFGYVSPTELADVDTPSRHVRHLVEYTLGKLKDQGKIKDYTLEVGKETERGGRVHSEIQKLLAKEAEAKGVDFTPEQLQKTTSEASGIGTDVWHRLDVPFEGDVQKALFGLDQPHVIDIKGVRGVSTMSPAERLSATQQKIKDYNTEQMSLYSQIMGTEDQPAPVAIMPYDTAITDEGTPEAEQRAATEAYAQTKAHGLVPIPQTNLMSRKQIKERIVQAQKSRSGREELIANLVQAFAFEGFEMKADSFQQSNKDWEELFEKLEPGSKQPIPGSSGAGKGDDDDGGRRNALLDLFNNFNFEGDPEEVIGRLKSAVQELFSGAGKGGGGDRPYYQRDKLAASETYDFFRQEESAGRLYPSIGRMLAEGKALPKVGQQIVSRYQSTYSKLLQFQRKDSGDWNLPIDRELAEYVARSQGITTDEAMAKYQGGITGEMVQGWAQTMTNRMGKELAYLGPLAEEGWAREKAAELDAAYGPRRSPTPTAAERLYLSKFAKMGELTGIKGVGAKTAMGLLTLPEEAQTYEEVGAHLSRSVGEFNAGRMNIIGQPLGKAMEAMPGLMKAGLEEKAKEFSEGLALSTEQVDRARDALKILGDLKDDPEFKTAVKELAPAFQRVVEQADAFSQAAEDITKKAGWNEQIANLARTQLEGPLDRDQRGQLKAMMQISQMAQRPGTYYGPDEQRLQRIAQREDMRTLERQALGGEPGGPGGGGPPGGGGGGGGAGGTRSFLSNLLQEFSIGGAAIRAAVIGRYTTGQVSQWEQAAMPLQMANMQMQMAYGGTYQQALGGTMGTLMSFQAAQRSFQQGLGTAALEQRAGLQSMLGIRPSYEAGETIGGFGGPLLRGLGTGLTVGVLGTTAAKLAGAAKLTGFAGTAAAGLGAIAAPAAVLAGGAVAVGGLAGGLWQAGEPGSQQEAYARYTMGENDVLGGLGYKFRSSLSRIGELGRAASKDTRPWGEGWAPAWDRWTTSPYEKGTQEMLRGYARSADLKVEQAAISIEKLDLGLDRAQGRELAGLLTMGGYSPEQIISGQAGGAISQLAPMAAMGQAGQQVTAMQRLGTYLGIAPGQGLQQFITGGFPTVSQPAQQAQWFMAAQGMGGMFAGMGQTLTTEQLSGWAQQLGQGVPLWQLQQQVQTQQGLGQLPQALGYTPGGQAAQYLNQLYPVAADNQEQARAQILREFSGTWELAGLTPEQQMQRAWQLEQQRNAVSPGGTSGTRLRTRAWQARLEAAAAGDLPMGITGYTPGSAGAIAVGRMAPIQTEAGYQAWQAARQVTTPIIHAGGLNEFQGAGLTSMVQNLQAMGMGPVANLIMQGFQGQGVAQAIAGRPLGVGMGTNAQVLGDLIARGGDVLGFQQDLSLAQFGQGQVGYSMMVGGWGFGEDISAARMRMGAPMPVQGALDPFEMTPYGRLPRNQYRQFQMEGRRMRAQQQRTMGTGEWATWTTGQWTAPQVMAIGGLTTEQQEMYAPQIKAAQEAEPPSPFITTEQQFGGQTFQMGLIGDIQQQQRHIAEFQQMRGLRARQRQLSYQQSSAGIGMSMAQAEMGYRHGMENIAHQQRMWEARTGFQRREMGFQYQQMQQQRGWQIEDLATQRETAGIEFGWGMEDLDRAIRFSTGRQKEQYIRQRERTEERYSRDETQRTKQEERAEKTFEQEDQRFARQREHFEEISALEEKGFAMQKRHLAESFALQMEQLSSQQGFLEENYELQEEMQRIQDESQEKDMEYQLAKMEQTQKYYDEVEFPLAEEARAIQEENLKLTGEYFTFVQGEWDKDGELYTNTDMYFDMMFGWTQRLVNLLAKIGAEPKQLGGEIKEGGLYRVGEAGPEDVFLPQGSYIIPYNDLLRGDQGGGGGAQISIQTVTISVQGAGSPKEVGRAVFEQFESKVNRLAIQQRRQGQPW